MLDDHPGGVNARGLLVRGVDPHIADLRLGEGDQLAAIGRICEDLLVARYGGVENDLPHRRAGGADGAAVKQAAIGKGKRR